MPLGHVAKSSIHSIKSYNTLKLLQVSEKFLLLFFSGDSLSRHSRQLVTCPAFAGFCSESYPGDICTVVCAYGRPNVPECQNDGTWTDAPRCIEHDPGVPEQIPGRCPGIPGYCSDDVYGGLCEFDCVKGPDIRSVCSPDGTWEPYPKCAGDIREFRDGCDPCPGEFGGPRPDRGNNATANDNGNPPRQPALPVNDPPPRPPPRQPVLPVNNNRNNNRNNNNNRNRNNNNSNRNNKNRHNSNRNTNARRTQLPSRRRPQQEPQVIQPARQTPFIPQQQPTFVQRQQQQQQPAFPPQQREPQQPAFVARNQQQHNRQQPQQPVSRPQQPPQQPAFVARNKQQHNRQQPQQPPQQNRNSFPSNSNRFPPQQQQTSFPPPSKSVIGRCPGGSLEACIDVCPSFSARIFGACVAGCARRCPESKKK